MSTDQTQSKEERVKKEVLRLRKIYKELPKEDLNIVEGLIIEAADLRIRLEDIRLDLDANGYDEMFMQSKDLEPYERERPQARRYIQLNKNYQSIMKHLTAYVVDRMDTLEDKKQKERELEALAAKENSSDGFDEFLMSND